MIIKDRIKERYIAGFLGCGYGDTLGMAVEGWKKQQIEKYLGRITEPIAPVLLKDAEGNLIKEDEFGKLGYYTRDLSKGDVTDDTILTMAIADSIIENKFLYLGDICKKQVAEYLLRLQPNGHVVGGFGRTTTDAFENLRKGVSPLESGVYPGLGNGPCMKIFPVGLYMHATNNYNEGIRIARVIGKATHLDERAIASGVVQADLIFELLRRNPSREQFLDYATLSCALNEKQNPENYPKSEKGNLYSRISWIKNNKDASPEEAKKILGNSALAFESYPFALFMFQKYFDNPLEGLLETVNYGGDCDTTGAIYGALAGAKSGLFFPENWQLNEKQRLVTLGEAIFNLRK
jgi:ADP-ribosylglycohydrolase